MAHFLAGLAGAAAARWKRSLAIVIGVLVLLAAGASLAGGQFADQFSTPGTESQQATDLLKSRFPTQAGDTATVVFSVDKGKVIDKSPAIASTLKTIQQQPHVTGVSSPLTSKGQISKNGTIAYATVQYDGNANDLGKEPGKRLEQATKPAAGRVASTSAGAARSSTRPSSSRPRSAS